MIVGRLTVPDEPVGAHMIAIRIEAFSFLPGFALSQAAATLVGQYLGSGQPSMARRAALTCLAYGASIMCTIGALFILIPGTLVLMVTNEPVFVESVPPLLHVVGWAQLGFATAMILSGAMRGAGDTRTTMMITFVSTYLIRLPVVWWLGMIQGCSLWVVWLVISLDLMLRGAMFAGYFLTGKWQKAKV